MSSPAPEAPRSDTESKTCASCQKTSANKHCAKCKGVYYCDRDCQKAHWKTHKKTCATIAAARGGGTASGEAPQRPDAKPFTAIYRNNFLHDRTEEETFKILIDTLRMRQEDMYTFHADTMTGTIYNGSRNSIPAFRQFIRKASAIDGFLPPWWTDAKLEECIEFSKNGAAGNFSLACAQEKSDIQETWKDPQMPMKVRMLGEKVYGTAPGGRKGDSMLEMMMNQENGSGANYMSMLNMAGLRM